MACWYGSEDAEGVLNQGNDVFGNSPQKGGGVEDAKIIIN